MAGGIGDTLGDIGGAVTDLFGASGATASANSYEEAQTIAEQNAALAAQSTRITEVQEQRQINQTIGTQRADVGGAGFAESGSALYLLRSSASQGALTKAETKEQGAITENAYAEQAGLYGGMAAAAKSSGEADTIGGIINAAGGVISGISSIGSAVSTVSSGISKVSGLISGGANSPTDGVTYGNFGNSAEVPVGSGVTPEELAGLDPAAPGGADSIIGASPEIEASVDAAEGTGEEAIADGVVDETATGIAGDLAADATVDAATDVIADGAADAAGDAVLGGIGDAIVDAIAAWVICTELQRQKRLPTRWYFTGARRFGLYDAVIKRGYYIWAVPAVRHLRAHPDSWFSKVLERVFCHRAEYIAAQYGIRGARKTLRGFATLAGVHALCWVLSRTIARKPIDWSVLYKDAA